MIPIVLLALLVGSCGPAPRGARDPNVEMTSLVGFEPARFAGSWHEVAAIGRTPGSEWQVTARANGRLEVRTTRDGAGQGRMTGPGRFVLSQFDAPLWVLWADADMRTVVIGTPDGRFAMVLDRGRRAAPDRLRAARGVLDWNGYDPEALS